MEFFNKFEKMALGWFKGVPSLPKSGQKWLSDNVWWVALVGAILTGIGILFALSGLAATVSLLSSTVALYYVSATATSWAVVTAIVSIAFAVLGGVLLAMAVQPLKEKQQKGWTLLFATWVLGALSVVVSAVLTLNIFSFIFSIIFGAVWLAISGYFLMQIHGQFFHVERSRGVKHAK